MEIEFKNVEGNEEDILKIKVDASQKYFVDSIKECLIRYHKNKSLNALAIYDNQSLIGFTMYGLKRSLFKGEEMWIDHFIIDSSFQGKGYGKKAFIKLLKIIKKENTTNEIFLSVHRKNFSAIHVYEKFGFSFTGKYNKYLEKIMILKY